MEQFLAAMDGAWRVLLVGLVLGAGLPALFAVGIRALAWGAGGDAEISDTGVTLKPHPLGRVIAYAMFAIVVLAVLLGVGYIVAHGLGWELTFNGVLPEFTKK
jgi:hypothetical protein